MLEWFFRVPVQFFTTCANATQRRKVVREKGKSSAIVDSDTPSQIVRLSAADCR